jgi:DNA replication protein DnaC
MSKFQIATKTQAKLRLAIAGPSGAGKTYSALAIASGLTTIDKVAVIDTEHGSADKYADIYRGFSSVKITDNYAPDIFVETIKDAEASGFEVLIIDSLTIPF